MRPQKKNFKKLINQSKVQFRGEPSTRHHLSKKQNKKTPTKSGLKIERTGDQDIFGHACYVGLKSTLNIMTRQTSIVRESA